MSAPPVPAPPVDAPPADLVLPEDVTGCGGVPDPDADVLVTGATGFLGAATVAELLDTHRTRRVYCVVRPDASGPGEVTARLHASLRRHGRWRPDWADRLVGLAGDLTAPACGLDRNARDRVAADVGWIYHSGAGVNVSMPYAALRAANVDGTVEVLRLACAGTSKRLAHVSTVSVLYGADRGLGSDGRVPDESALPSAARLAGGYPTTKWVAELLVAEARARGVDALTVRFGGLAGSAASGVSNPQDYAWLFLRCCAHLGRAPIAQVQVGWAPVDHAARALVHLSEHPADPRPPAHHVVTPEHVPYGTMFSWARRFGYQLRMIDYRRWRRDLVAAAVAPDAPIELRLLAAAVPDEGDGGPGPPAVAADRTDAYLADAGIRCPRLDEALMHHYLDVGVRRGELPAPARAGRNDRRAAS